MPSTKLVELWRSVEKNKTPVFDELDLIFFVLIQKSIIVNTCINNILPNACLCLVLIFINIALFWRCVLIKCFCMSLEQ